MGGSGTKQGPKVDWDAIRAEREANNGSRRAIARRYHLTEAAIRMREAREGWVIRTTSGDVDQEKRRLVAEKLLEPRPPSPLPEPRSQRRLPVETQITTIKSKISALEVAATQDADVMRRVAHESQRSIELISRLLGEAEAALDAASELGWKETTIQTKDGDGTPNGNCTTKTEKAPSRLDHGFNAAKIVKISTEALQVARKVYAESRGLEKSGDNSVNVSVNAQAQAGAQVATEDHKRALATLEPGDIAEILDEMDQKSKRLVATLLAGGE